MSNRVLSDAENLLRMIKREFAFAFAGKGKNAVPDLVLRLADMPQPVSPLAQKEMTTTPSVFASFKELLTPESLRVMSFESPHDPWFDLAFEADEHSIFFRIRIVHPISELKSAV